MRRAISSGSFFGAISAHTPPECIFANWQVARNQPCNLITFNWISWVYIRARYPTCVILTQFVIDFIESSRIFQKLLLDYYWSEGRNLWSKTKKITKSITGLSLEMLDLVLRTIRELLLLPYRNSMDKKIVSVTLHNSNCPEKVQRLLVLSWSVEIGFSVDNFLVRWFCKFDAFTYKPSHFLFVQDTSKMLILILFTLITVLTKLTNGKCSQKKSKLYSDFFFKEISLNNVPKIQNCAQKFQKVQCYIL